MATRATGSPAGGALGPRLAPGASHQQHAPSPARLLVDQPDRLAAPPAAVVSASVASAPAVPALVAVGAVAVPATAAVGLPGASAVAAPCASAVAVAGAHVQQHVGGADDPVAVGAEAGARVAAGRRERRPPRRGPAGRREGVGQGPPAGVGLGVGGGQGAERGLDLGPVDAVERHQLGHLQVELGDRARLVGAHHVDPGQALDGGQFLHQHPAPAQAQHAGGEGDAR